MPTSRSRPATRAPQDVTALLDGLAHPHRSGIEALRRWILDLDPRITEELKWNAPSFRREDHFATFRLHPPKHIQLVLHTGAKVRADARALSIDDPAGLLRWAAPDRAVLTFASEADLRQHRDAVLQLLRQWVAQL